MKLKGLTKLALSGVALAAVAATLGTSTYAWYVSNSKAEVSNISGQSNTQAAGSLLINKLKTGSNLSVDPTAWTNKIDYDNLINKSSTALDPITRDGSNGTYTAGDGVTGWHKVDGNAIDFTTAGGYFMFGIKTTDPNKTRVTMTLGIQNTSTTTGDNVDVQPQTAYVGSDKGAPTNVNAGDTFYEDFIYALKFDFTFKEILTGNEAKPAVNYIDNGISATANNVTTVTQYDAYSAETFKNYGQTAAYSALSGAKTDGNAHTYYKALSEDYVNNPGTNNAAIAGGESDGASTYGTSQYFDIPDSEKEYVFIMRYWLDGADAQCFDSCISQHFQLSIKLSTSSAS